tara:strand:- start:1315 stop:2133 length:819 start_codon:yes stop_codon:yes gene_type:complete
MDDNTEKTILKVCIAAVIVFLIGITSIFASGVLNNNNAPKIISAQPQQITTTTQTMISAQHATNIASSTIQGTIKEVELTTVNGKQVYEVDVEQGEKEFSIEIDPFTSEVLRVVEETELGQQDIDLINPLISKEQAKTLALTQVQGTITEVEAEKENDVYIWDVEFKGADIEISVKIDMMSGKILRIEQEAADDDDEDEQIPSTVPATPTDTSVTIEQAKQIALKELGGGRVTDTDTKSSGSIFEIEVKKDGKEYDVLVQKSNGKVLGIERD